VNENEKLLAKGLMLALEHISHLLRTIDQMKWKQEALEQILAAQSPQPDKLLQSIAAETRQVARDAPASGHTSAEAIAALKDMLDQVRDLAQ
jgi:hypothetical protein